MAKRSLAECVACDTVENFFSASCTGGHVRILYYTLSQDLPLVLLGNASGQILLFKNVLTRAVWSGRLKKKQTIEETNWYDLLVFILLQSVIHGVFAAHACCDIVAGPVIAGDWHYAF